MKMEISAEQLGTLRANFPLLETKYSTAFVVFKLTNQREEHQVVWIRGSIDGVYLAKMALMVNNFYLDRLFFPWWRLQFMFRLRL